MNQINIENSDEALQYEGTHGEAISPEERLKKAQRRNKVVLFSIVGVILLYIVGSILIDKMNDTYIEGNVLKVSKTNAEYEINPWNNTSFSDQLVFQSLFMTDSSFTEVDPALAESYEISEDGMTYVITLKEEQKWSDGEDLTVEDVVFSIEALLLCENANVTLSTAFVQIVGAEEWQAGESESLAGVTAEGNEITIQLQVPYNSFALVLTQFVVFPEHMLADEDPDTFILGNEFFEDPVCSGMFMVDSIDENGDIELVQNPYYSGEQTEIEKVILYADYQNVNLDYYATTNITEMVSYRSMTGFEEYFVDVYFYRYFVFNIAGGYEVEGQDVVTEENEAMQDVRVRQAIVHAIDIETLLHDLYFDTGTLVYGGATSLAEEVYEYDPDKARALLEEAGYDFDRPFTIGYYHTDSTTAVFLERVSEYLEEVGLTVELLALDSSEQIYEEHEYDMFLKALSAFSTEHWYNEYISTSGVLEELLGTEGLFDDLIAVMSSTNDEDEYADTMLELVELEQELVYKIPLFTLNDSVYINSNRLYVPEDMAFGNTRYRSNLRIDEWYIMKD